MKYYRPVSEPELLDLLGTLDQSNYTLLAGGTDLMPRFESGMELPLHLVDLKGIDCFSGINDRGDNIEIGSLTTIDALRKSDLIHQSFQALWQATDQFAATQIRNRATIGGNICNASPAGDTLPPLYAYQAQVRIIGPAGERQVPIADFISGPGKTALNPSEILFSVILPKAAGFSTFYKLGLRQAMAVSVINFAVVAVVDREKKVFNKLTIAAGSVAPTVKYLNKLAGALQNNGNGIDGIIDLVDQDISPIDDIRATAAYRRKALKNILAFTLKELVNKR
ncbi:MAG: xanthine dehydrogenase family protein subunit M [Candidatus Marinimicrobia bacterium]|nr:xanthine dehydrogenase family protein subunit M [Candidatus Neomarinimicrobiota bacterium]